MNACIKKIILKSSHAIHNLSKFYVLWRTWKCYFSPFSKWLFLCRLDLIDCHFQCVCALSWEFSWWHFLCFTRKMVFSWFSKFILMKNIFLFRGTHITWFPVQCTVLLWFFIFNFVLFHFMFSSSLLLHRKKLSHK